MRDRLGREVNYLRISVTGRCNLRCVYCVPAERGTAAAEPVEMTPREIGLIARAAVELGIFRIRLTGGEPLLRKDLCEIVRAVRSVPAITDLSLTTNGQALEGRAKELAEAGLSRVNVSINSLDPARYLRITRGASLTPVLGGLWDARAAGLEPVKVNVVLLDGFSARELRRFVALARQGVLVRFIELMPVGEACKLRRRRATAETLMRQVVRLGLGDAANREEPVAVAGAGPARYFAVSGRPGSLAAPVTLGVIDPLSSHLCPRCNRLRVTSSGTLRSCLGSESETELIGPVRACRTDSERVRTARELIRDAILSKPAGGRFTPAVGASSMRWIGG